MSANLPPYEAGQSLPIGKAVITTMEASQLRRLYAELPDAAAAARQALKAAHGPVTGAQLHHFREINAQLMEVIDSIKAIVG